MKIVYCLNSVSYIGGIEKTTILKANALAEILGNEIFIIVTDVRTNAESTTMLSSKIQVIDLDVNYFADDWKSRWHIIKGIVVKRRLHRRLLERQLHKISPDIVISVGTSEKYFLPFLRGNWATIREFHFYRYYRRLEAGSLVGKIVARLNEWYESLVMKRYNHIVVLTNEDKKQNWSNTKNISVIPNLVKYDKAIPTIAVGVKKIIAVGRLEKVKNFLSLIYAFRMVAVCHPDWVLEIYGDGSERLMLQKTIDELKLNDNIFLKGNTVQIEEKMSKAYCLVLSSIHEGFGLVLIEAMSCGLPVVSYDCPCGPKDIVTDGVDGFLVPTGNERMLAEKICFLIEHPDIYYAMREAARAKSRKYNTDIVIPMWMELFKKLQKSKLR